MQRLKAYLPALLWMAVIFVASTDLGSTRHTSRIIGPLLRWFKPDVSDETITAVQAVVRKGGHVTEYAILAILFWRGKRIAQGMRPLLKAWDWCEAWMIVLWCGLYAVSDEVHQKFVASRQGQALDVLIDSVGALCGLLVLWAIGRSRKRG
jgi:VanZ family protein